MLKRFFATDVNKKEKCTLAMWEKARLFPHSKGAFLSPFRPHNFALYDRLMSVYWQTGMEPADCITSFERAKIKDYIKETKDEKSDRFDLYDTGRQSGRDPGLGGCVQRRQGGQVSH